jgi:hypothetical protein
MQFELPKSNQEFYDRLDVVASKLHEIGMGVEAAGLSNVIHKACWTTTTELFWELGQLFRDLLSDEKSTRLPAAFRVELRAYLEMLDNLR